MLLIFLFMKLTHIQVFKNRMHEAQIQFYCLQADTLFFILMFCMFRYIYDKIYTNEYLNRDIIVYLKYDVHLKKTYEYTCRIKLLN